VDDRSGVVKESTLRLSLFKLREFHRTHATPLEQTVADMNEAFGWLPNGAYVEATKVESQSSEA